VIDYSKHTKAKRKVARGDADAALRKYGVGSRVLKFANDTKPQEPAQTQTPDEESFVLEQKREEEQAPIEQASTEKRESMADNSAELLAGLDETTRRVFESLPIDKAVSPDALAAAGIGVGDAITSLTMLELCGLVSSLPGGLYVRK
jgi:hypothetical protein